MNEVRKVERWVRKKKLKELAILIGAIGVAFLVRAILLLLGV